MITLQENYMSANSMNSKMSLPDRILKLKPKEGADLTKAMLDKKLFSGENNLHAIKNNESGFWSFRYEAGILPEPLRAQSFTSFRALKKFAEAFFIKKDIEITEVVQ